MTTRPDSTEYPPYFGKYITLVPDGDIVRSLAAIGEETSALLRTVSEEKSLHRYQPGKWSIREAYVHLIDGERIFGYRALRLARADQTPLPSFDQDSYVGPSGADARSWASIIDEYQAVRAASLSLFANLPADAWTRTGTVSGNVVSVRSVAYIVGGHDIHHRNLLRDCYL